MSSTTELIKSKLDIVEFIRGYVALTPAGRNLKGLCPFHHEKSPSFMVSPERQSWHCFGCDKGGDAFAFLMQYENLDFNEALRALAERTHVELRHENPAEYKFSGLLYDLNDQAKNFYRTMLAASPGAQKYFLEERGLTQETIETFELGWAPNEPEALAMHLLNLGTAPQDLIQAGLAIKTERGMMLDRFRARLMFPIHNHMGRVVGFTGRIHPQFDPSKNPAAASPSGFVPAKYVNSPETPIFQKAKILYGFWKSKDAIREAKSVLLVEGQMDFLMSWQAGVKNVAASSGTALTVDHLKALRRFAEKLIFLFDDDSAGERAGERAEGLPKAEYKKVLEGPQKGEVVLDLAQTTDFDVQVVTLGKYKDPAEAVIGDVEYFKHAVENPRPMMDIYIERYISRSGTDYTQRENLNNLRVVINKIRHLSSVVQQEQWFKKLAAITGLSQKTLELEGGHNEKVARTDTRDKEEQSPRVLSRQERLVEELIAIALAKNEMTLLDDSLDYLASPQKEIWLLLAAGTRKSDDPALDARLELVVMRPARELSDAEVVSLKSELAKEYYKERRKIITQAIKNAEANGNAEEHDAALAELNRLPSGE